MLGSGDAHHLKQFVKVPRVLLNVDGVLVNYAMNTFQKLKGVAGLFHAMAGDLVLGRQGGQQLVVKVLLLCQNKHIINVQKNQAVFVPKQTWVSITTLESKLDAKETADTLLNQS